MKKFYFGFIIVLFLASCSVDFKPSDFVPDLDEGVEEIFPDSIGDLGGDIKLELYDDDCKSISATYGDDQEIYVQLFYLSSLSFNKCYKRYLKNKITVKVKKNYGDFKYFADDGDYYYMVWHNKDFCFYIKCLHNRLYDLIDNTDFLVMK